MFEPVFVSLQPDRKSFLPFDDPGFSEVFFEAGVVEEAGQEGVFECVVGGQKDLIDVLGGSEGFFFLFVLQVCSHFVNIILSVGLLKSKTRKHGNHSDPLLT